MREYKFRMWNKKEKKMYDVGVLDFDYKQVYMKGYLNYTTSSFQIEDIELMQFTGLHDKNGKEIYEGDIVKIKYRKGFKLGQAIYEEFIARVMYGSEYASFIIGNCNPSIIVHECENLGDYKDIEVIGNIYENPELLKGADNI